MIDRSKLTDAEREQLNYELKLSNDIKDLMENETFKRVIMDLYINDTALVIGSSFTGSESDMEALKAVTHLRSFLYRNMIED
jgi:hypothetical protein